MRLWRAISLLLLAIVLSTHGQVSSTTVLTTSSADPGASTTELATSTSDSGASTTAPESSSTSDDSTADTGTTVAGSSGSTEATSAASGGTVQTTATLWPEATGSPSGTFIVPLPGVAPHDATGLQAQAVQLLANISALQNQIANLVATVGQFNSSVLASNLTAIQTKIGQLNTTLQTVSNDVTTTLNRANKLSANVSGYEYKFQCFAQSQCISMPTTVPTTVTTPYPNGECVNTSLVASSTVQTLDYANQHNLNCSKTIQAAQSGNQVLLNATRVNLSGNATVVVSDAFTGKAYATLNSSSRAGPIATNFSTEVVVTALTLENSDVLDIAITYVQADACLGFACEHGGSCSSASGQAICTCVGCYADNHCQTPVEPPDCASRERYCQRNTTCDGNKPQTCWVNNVTCAADCVCPSSLFMSVQTWEHDAAATATATATVKGAVSQLVRWLFPR